MAMDRWGVLPGGETAEDEFVLAFQDLSAGQGQPFMRDLGPMSEAKIRDELAKLSISKAEIDAAIAKARKSKAEAKDWKTAAKNWKATKP